MSKIVILGGGESGWGAAVLAQKKGFEVFLSDSGNISTKYKNLLNQYNINWEDGGHSERMILDADEVIKSPGIPNEAPIVAKLRSLGVPIISEIQFRQLFSRYDGDGTRHSSIHDIVFHILIPFICKEQFI